MKQVVRWRICMPFRFWSTRISLRNWWSRDEILLLIQFEQIKVDQKQNLEPYSITWSWSLRNFAFSPTPSKSKRHAYASRDFPLHIQKWIKSLTTAYWILMHFFPYQTFSRSKILGRSDHRRFFKIHERNSPWTSLITSQLNRQYKQRSTVDVSNYLYYKPMTDRHSGINCCHWSHEESNGEGGFRQEIDEDISRVSFSSNQSKLAHLFLSE